MNESILGLDLGGVVIDVWQNGNDKLFFSDDYLRTPEVIGAFNGILKLREEFGKRIVFVSHCSNENRAKFIAWMDRRNFYELTGTKLEDISFCLERSQKARICIELGVTHFVDDRLEILSSLETVKSRFLFQPRKEDSEEYAAFLPMVKIVKSWEQLLEEISSALA